MGISGLDHESLLNEVESFQVIQALNYPPSSFEVIVTVFDSRAS